jgi:hypothetical protein
MGEVEVGESAEKFLGLPVISDCGFGLVIETAKKGALAEFADTYIPFVMVFVPSNSFVF